MQAFVMAHNPLSQIVQPADDHQNNDDDEKEHFPIKSRERGEKGAVKPGAFVLSLDHANGPVGFEGGNSRTVLYQ